MLIFKSFAFLVFTSLLFPALAGAQTGVVSTSLCGDGYVLALAGPTRIKALSWQADGPLSQAPDKWSAWPKASADAETLLALNPAYIVLGPEDNSEVARLSRLRGAGVFSLNWTDDFAGINQNLLELADFLQNPAAGIKQVSKQQSRLAALMVRHRARSRTPKVLYLTPTLGTAGADTFVDAAITAAGGINLARQMGISGWGQVPLETLARQEPDLIITSFFTDGPPSVYQFRAQHSILRRITARVPKLEISGSLWVCGGPYLIEATEQIADALDAQNMDKSP